MTILIRSRKPAIMSSSAAQDHRRPSGSYGASVVGSVRWMDEGMVRAWFEEYLEALATCGRGESENLDVLLGYYAVPLVVSTEDAATALTSADEVLGFAAQQVAGMRSASYHRTVILGSDVSSLNSTSALYRGTFARERADGSEIARLGVTYFVTSGSEGPRISALALQP